MNYVIWILMTVTPNPDDASIVDKFGLEHECKTAIVDVWEKHKILTKCVPLKSYVPFKKAPK